MFQALQEAIILVEDKTIIFKNSMFDKLVETFGEEQSERDDLLNLKFLKPFRQE